MGIIYFLRISIFQAWSNSKKKLSSQLKLKFENRDCMAEENGNGWYKDLETWKGESKCIGLGSWFHKKCIHSNSMVLLMSRSRRVGRMS